MYKSLLRKIEFLAPLWKVWRLHFLAPTYSSAHMRLSACLLGVFSPNTAQQRCTVWPTPPPSALIRPPWWRRAERRSLGHSSAMAAEHGATGGDEWRACQTSGWAPLSQGKCQEDCQESLDAHADLPQWRHEWRPRACHHRAIRWICSSTVVKKLESWGESPPLTEGRELAGEWKKRESEGERGYSEHDSFPSLSACLDLNTLSHSRWEKCLRPSHCWPPLSSFLFAIKCISNGTTVQGAFLIRQNSIAFNLLLLWLCNFWGLLLWGRHSQNISLNWKCRAT